MALAMDMGPADAATGLAAMGGYEAEVRVGGCRALAVGCW
jgi:hypothetical protein